MDTDRTTQDASWVTETGNPVRRAVPTPDVAAVLAKQLEEADYLPSIRRARVKGMADGNPPYKQKDLIERGLGFMANINFRELGALLDQKAGQSFELFQEVPQLITVTIEAVDADPDSSDAQPREKWEDIIAHEFTTTLQDWPAFQPTMDFVRRQADLFGVGILMWRDPWDWKPVQVPRGAFHPSPFASVVIDDWVILGTSDTRTAHELLAILDEPEVAEEEGWNVAAMRAYLARLFFRGEGATTNDSTTSTGTALTSPWEKFQQALRINQPDVVARLFENVPLRHLYVKEPKGGLWSHYILPGDLSVADGWLFKAEDAFSKLSEYLWILPYNYGDGLLKSIRSLAEMTETFFDVSNRFLGRILDAGFAAGGLLLQAADVSTDPRHVQLLRSGLVTMVPSNVKVLPSNNFTPPILPMAQIRELAATVMKNNTGEWKQNPESFAGERQRDVTAREVAENVAREARLEKSNVSFAYTQYELLYREIMRRLLALGNAETPDESLPGAPEAIEFVRRCINRGVPREVLNMSSLTVRAFRAIGLGSWGVRKDIAQMVFNMRGSFDVAGQTNATRDLLTVLVGPHHVNRYKATENRDQIPSNAHSHATLENNDLAEGTSCLASSDQKHVIHIMTHAAHLQGLIKAVQESGGNLGDPMRVLQSLEVTLQHVSEHMQFAAQDPALQQFLAEVKPLLDAGLKIRDDLIRVVEEMQKAQQKMQEEQQRMLAEARGIVANQENELKRMKAAGELQIKADMNRSLMDMRQSRQDHANSISTLRTQHDIELKRVAQEAKIALERQATEAKIEIERLKAELASARGGRGE